MALDAAEPHQQLRAALGQIDALLHENALLRQSVAPLEQALADANRLALHDELTGLANRRLVMERFQRAVTHREPQSQRVALLFMDVDGFKRVNDDLGHLTGDRLLRSIAARLSNCVRACDTVCRYGGDEFVVLLTDWEGEDGALAALEHIRTQLREPHLIEGTPIEVSACIGLAIFPTDGEDFDSLLQSADAAMAEQKSRTKGSKGECRQRAAEPSRARS